MDKWFFYGVNLQKLEDWLNNRVVLCMGQKRGLAQLEKCKVTIRLMKEELATTNTFSTESYAEYKAQLGILYSWYKVLMMLKENSSADLPLNFNLHMTMANDCTELQD